MEGGADEVVEFAGLGSRGGARRGGAEGAEEGAGETHFGGIRMGNEGGRRGRA